MRTTTDSKNPNWGGLGRVVQRGTCGDKEPNWGALGCTAAHWWLSGNVNLAHPGLTQEFLPLSALSSPPCRPTLHPFHTNIGPQLSPCLFSKNWSVHAHIYTCTHVPNATNTQTSKHTHFVRDTNIQTHTHTYTHTHVHTHMHMHKLTTTFILVCNYVACSSTHGHIEPCEVKG